MKKRLHWSVRLDMKPVNIQIRKESKGREDNTEEEEKEEEDDDDDEEEEG